MFLMLLVVGYNMVDINERLNVAHTEAKARVNVVLRELKSLSVQVGDLQLRMDEVSAIKLSEKAPAARVKSALNLLANELHSNHQEISKAFAILAFMNSKVNDPKIPQEAMRQFKEKALKLYKIDSNALRSSINSACSDLQVVMKAEFDAQLSVNKNVSDIRASLVKILADVESL